MTDKSTPWKHPELDGWAIVGMNHYLHDDEMFLFVAMTSGHYCIIAEGPDDGAIWVKLRSQACEIDARLARGDAREALRGAREHEFSDPGKAAAIMKATLRAIAEERYG